MQDILSIEKRTNNRHVKAKRNCSALVDLSSRFSTLIRPTKHDVSSFKEQFYTLILNTDNRERKVIAKNLSACEYAPKPIIIFFALEEIAIANLPLLYSPVLQPADLNLIVEKCSIEHGKVIARRVDLDASTIKALLKLDDENRQIYHALNSNRALVENPKILELINAPTSSNKWVEQPAETITHSHVKLEKPSVSPKSKDLSASLLQLANVGGKLGRKPAGKPAKSTFTKITQKQIEHQLLASARFSDLSSFAKSVEHFCGLKHQTTIKLLANQDAGMLASLLCAMEIREISAARILLMLNRNIGRNAKIFKVVMEKYKNLNREHCLVYFTKLGADFSREFFHDGEDKSTTRYALSLAARDRRAILLRQKQDNNASYQEEKLIA